MITRYRGFYSIAPDQGEEPEEESPDDPGAYYRNRERAGDLARRFYWESDADSEEAAREAFARQMPGYVLHGMHELETYEAALKRQAVVGGGG